MASIMELYFMPRSALFEVWGLHPRARRGRRSVRAHRLPGHADRPEAGRRGPGRVGCREPAFPAATRGRGEGAEETAQFKARLQKMSTRSGLRPSLRRTFQSILETRASAVEYVAFAAPRDGSSRRRRRRRRSSSRRPQPDRPRQDRRPPRPRPARPLAFLITADCRSSWSQAEPGVDDRASAAGVVSCMTTLPTIPEAPLPDLPEQDPPRRIPVPPSQTSSSCVSADAQPGGARRPSPPTQAADVQSIASRRSRRRRNPLEDLGPVLSHYTSAGRPGTRSRSALGQRQSRGGQLSVC